MLGVFFENKILQMTSTRFLKGLVTILSLSFALSACSEPESDKDSPSMEGVHVEMTNEDITSLFDEWNSALQTGNPKNVAALYEDTAILLPTMSNKVRHNHDEIEDYFVQFLAKSPEGKIDEANIRIFGEIAINSGLYTFSFQDDTTVQARFTFVYRWNGQRWMIVEHHSSAMPE